MYLCLHTIIYLQFLYITSFLYLHLSPPPLIDKLTPVSSPLLLLPVLAHIFPLTLHSHTPSAQNMLFQLLHHTPLFNIHLHYFPNSPPLLPPSLLSSFHLLSYFRAVYYLLLLTVSITARLSSTILSFSAFVTFLSSCRVIFSSSSNLHLSAAPSHHTRFHHLHGSPSRCAQTAKPSVLFFQLPSLHHKSLCTWNTPWSRPVQVIRKDCHRKVKSVQPFPPVLLLFSSSSPLPPPLPPSLSCLPFPVFFLHPYLFICLTFPWLWFMILFQSLPFGNLFLLCLPFLLSLSLLSYSLSSYSVFCFLCSIFSPFSAFPLSSYFSPLFLISSPFSCFSCPHLFPFFSKFKF